MKKFTVRMAATMLDSIHPGNIINTSLVKVFEKDFVFNTTGWTDIPLSFPFNWDGTSNILVDISYEDDENVFANLTAPTPG